MGGDSDCCADGGSPPSGMDGWPLLSSCLSKATAPGAFEKAAQQCLDLAAEQQSDTDRIQVILGFMQGAAAALRVDGEGGKATLATSDEACAAVDLQALQDAPSQWHDGLEKVMHVTMMLVPCMKCSQYGVSPVKLVLDPLQCMRGDLSP